MSEDRAGDILSGLHSQDGEKRVGLAGWIGESPEDGGDFLFLLLHPWAHGIADRMRKVADILGLERGDQGLPMVPPDTAYLAIGPSDGDDAVWLHHGEAGWIHRPMPAVHLDVLRARGEAMLVLGVDGFDGMSRPKDLERYLSRQHRLYLGRLRLV